MLRVSSLLCDSTRMTFRVNYEKDFQCFEEIFSVKLKREIVLINNDFFFNLDGTICFEMRFGETSR